MNKFYDPLAPTYKTSEKRNIDPLAPTKIEAINNIDIASQLNPDLEAENQKLADFSGLPLDVVRQAPELVKAKINKNRSAYLLTNNPKTESYLSDFRNASTSLDDIEALTEVEKASSKFEIFKAGLKEIPANALSTLKSYIDVTKNVSDTYNLLTDRNTQYDAMSGIYKTPKLPDTLTERTFKEIQKNIIYEAEKFDTSDIKMGTGVEKWVNEIIKTSPQVIVQTGIALIPGIGIGLSTAFMGSQIQGSEYRKLVDFDNVDESRAFVASIADALAQIPLERIGLEKALSFWKPNNVSSRVKAFVESAGTEFVTEAIQKYPEAIAEIWANAEKKGQSAADQVNQFFEDFTKITAEAIYEGSIGSVFGGATGSVAYQANLMAKKAEANNFADELEKVAKKIDQTKTKSRSSINTLKFIRNLGIDRYAYVTQDGIDRLYQGEKEDADRIINEIRAENVTSDSSEIKIDTHKLINLPEGDRNRLLNDIKSTLNGYSKNEIANLNIEEEVQKNRDYYAEFQESEKTFQGEISRIKTEGKKAGVTPGEMDAFTTLVDRFANRMGLEGLDKTEFVKKITISRPGSKAEIERVLRDGLFQEVKTGTKEFKNWFGDSKVVDSSGKPLTVYHGTDANISEFDVKRGFKTEEGHPSAALGSFFSKDAGISGIYTGKAKSSRGVGGNIIPVYLSIKNPYYAEATELMNISSFVQARNLVKKLKNQGYDGIIQKSFSGLKEDELNQIVAFKPTQIKSIFNRGTFSPTDPNILFQEGVFNNVKQIQSKWEAEGVNAFLYEDQNTIDINTIIVPKEKRKTGIGTKIMEDLIEYADRTGKRLELTPALKDDFHGTTSRSRLIKFYKRFGFVENKGRNKDYTISKLMYRDPSKQKLVEKVKEGIQKLFQPKRGALTISGDRYAIQLLQSDKSTLFHELGHVFLSEMKLISDSGSATSEFLKDYETLSEYLNIHEDGTIDVAAQEKFAESFERYLLDGVAPSADLKTVFMRIKEWLTSVYESILASNIPAQIPEEIKEVFDNILSVKQLSEESMIENNMTTLSNDEAKKLGITPEDKRAMSKLLKQAQMEAEDEYYRDLRIWKAQWKKQAEIEFEASQVGRAIKFLREGSALNFEEVRTVYGDETADTLRKKRLSKKDGMSLLEANTQIGYETEQDLITALLTSPSKTEYVKQSVDANTIDWTYRIRPEEYINTTQPFADYMDIKNRYINRAEGRTVEKAAMDVFAKEKLASMPVKDAINTRRFLSDFKRHTDKERSAIRSERIKDASDANYMARMSHAMAKRSMTIRKEVEKLQRQVKGLSKSKSMSQDSLNQVRDLAARFGLIRVDGKKMIPEEIQSALSGMDPSAQEEFKRKYLSSNDLQMSVLAVRNQVNESDRMTLMEWAKERDGYEIDFPDFIASSDNLKDYKELSYGDFQELSDAFFIIKHVDHEERYFTALNEKITIQEVVTKLRERLVKTQKLKGVDFEPNNVKEFFDNGVAIHTKMETLFRKLDGEVTGDFYHYMFEPLSEAESARDDRLKIEAKSLRAIFKEIKDANKREFISQLPKEHQNLRRQQLISMALNTGNSDNKAKLIDGYGWSEEQLNFALDKLTKEDWDIVQKIWDYVDTFKGESFALDKEIKGRTPKEIKAEKVFTKFGEYAGGYYPILYDRRLSWSSFRHGQLDDIKSLFKKTYATSNTRAGSLNERVASAGDKKIKLDLTVISDHIFEVVHDITHRKAILNVAKLMRNTELQTYLTNTIGVNMQSQMYSWLEDIAKEQANASDVYHKLFRWARTSTSMMAMGLKFTTMAQQFVGYTQTIDELGIKQAAKGIRMFYGIGNDYAKIGERIEFAKENSGFMRNRMQSFDRDIRDITKFGGKLDKKQINKIAFSGIGFMQMGVDMPTWYAGYDKALKDGKTHEQAIQFADSIVRQTQGAGGTKDLSKIQRGDEAIRLFTMFYSYFNTLFNLGSLRVTQIKQARLDKKIAIAASAAIWLWFMPQLLSEAVSGRGPEEDEEWVEWALPLLANYPFQTVIGVREVANYAFSGWDYSITPAESAPKSVGDFLTTWYKVYNDEKDIQQGIEQTAKTTGYLFGLPLNQIIILLGNFYDYSTGDNPDFDYQDFMRRNRS